MEKTVGMAAPGPRAGSSAGLVILAYAATIFFSAFLLFQVQPLISRFILPWFGGSPAVWTAAMLFFQMALFGGYLYAHLTSSFLAARGQFLLHLILLVAAAALTLATYVSPGESLKPLGEDGESPLLQILVLLSVTVGLPYFVLSSTGPLLQKWFSDAFEGVSPYRLFALSNLGSLLALLSYPFFFEVYWDSPEQARMWSYAFLFFAVCCAFCAWWTYQARSTAPKASPALQSKVPIAADHPPAIWQRIAWIGLPSLASVMFLAVTNEVTQNVATVPLLWIIPLSLYLLSFIVAFDHPRWYSRTIYAALALVLLAYMSNFRSISGDMEDLLNWLLQRTGDDEILFRHNLAWRCTVFFSGLFVVCMICHCELAALKPSPKYLTSFYMTMSLGGAIGGILVNLVAPYVFVSFFELPLSELISVCIAAVLLVIGAGQAYRSSRESRRSESTSQPAGITAAKRAVAGLLGLSAVAYVGLQIVDIMTPSTDTTSKFIYRGRSFYGLVSARHNDLDTPEQSYLTFKSGSIAHGRQWSHPDRQRETSIAYWGPGSGCRRALEYATEKYEKCRIGVVGLGIGTIAGFAKPGQYVRMYEINPQAIEIAEEHFFFLKNARADGVDIPQVVLGDARLQLERELRDSGSHEFDVLCLDAFSGDAVPMHLLTTEAFEVYKKHLKPNGIIVANVTNTYLDLYPVVRKLAETHGFKHTRVFKDPNKELCFPTYFVLITNDEEFLATTPEDLSDAKPQFLKQREAPLWTDRYHSLWHVLQ